MDGPVVPVSSMATGRVDVALEDPSMTRKRDIDGLLLEMGSVKDSGATMAEWFGRMKKARFRASPYGA